MYFSELFDVWFPADLVPTSFNREAAFRTFMQGGYYRHDFEDSTTSLLALNTMFFMKENECEFDKADEQLEWLE